VQNDMKEDSCVLCLISKYSSSIQLGRLRNHSIPVRRSGIFIDNPDVSPLNTTALPVFSYPCCHTGETDLCAGLETHSQRSLSHEGCEPVVTTRTHTNGHSYWAGLVMIQI